MIYLIVLGVVILFFGLVLLFAPAFMIYLNAIFNRSIIYLYEKKQSVRIWMGLLLLLGCWLLWLIARNPELSYLNPVWIICLVFGILFLIFPNWLSWTSKASGKVVFSTDEVVMTSRKTFGILLVISSIYIFYTAYLLR